MAFMGLLSGLASNPLTLKADNLSEPARLQARFPSPPTRTDAQMFSRYRIHNRLRRHLRDFVAAWKKVMNLDRYDLA
jgi:hypothetical protein